MSVSSDESRSARLTRRWASFLGSFVVGLAWALLACTTAPTPTPRPLTGAAPLSTAVPPLTTTLPIVIAEPSVTPAPTATPEAMVKRILLVTATEGFVHSSIPTAQTAFRQLAEQSGEFTVTLLATSADLTQLDAPFLAAHDGLVFANTSGELPLTETQKAALLDFVAGGGGFIGTHSATDTLYGWEEYGELIGATFHSHPWVQEATITVEDTSHPTSAGLGEAYTFTEEFYTFRSNPRPTVHVLQSLDAASVGASGDFPLVWWKEYGAGRVYYTALGHFEATWEDPRFQTQLLAALRWVTE